MNLQVVAVGCYDVAAEVAVAAVVGDWKGFREGFPEEWELEGKCQWRSKYKCLLKRNLGNVPRWASFASLSTTPSSSPYTCQHKTSDTSYEKVQTRHKPLFLYIRFYIRHISVQYFPSIYTCCSTTIHIKPHISPQLQPLVFVSPQSEVWWINKSCHGGREAPPFKSHLFANWGNSSKSFDRITQSTFGDFTIITFAVSEWKTSSAAKSVCMLVTRKRIRLSCKAGNSSWSSEFPVLGQRWKDFFRTIIYFDM